MTKQEFLKLIHEKDVNLSENYNISQLSFLYTCLQKNKDISNINNSSYSANRMNLILKSNDDFYKNPEITDLQAHCIFYKLMNKEEILSKNDEEIKKDVYEKYKRSPKFNNVNNIRTHKDDFMSNYLINNDKILEIVRDEQFIRYCNCKRNFPDFIKTFGYNEVLNIINKNIDNIYQYFEKTHFIDYNIKTNNYYVYDLFANKDNIYYYNATNTDYNNIINKIIKDYIDNCKINIKDAKDYDYLHKFNKIFEIFNELNINIENYYLIKNINNEYKELVAILCISKDENIQEYIKKNYSGYENCEEILEEAQSATERLLRDKYIINEYDLDGNLISGIDTLFNMEQINFMLNNGLKNMTQMGSYCNINDFLDSLKK